MKPVFGTPIGTGVGRNRRNRDADTDAKDVRECRIALLLVDDDEAARIGQALDAADGGHAAERRQHHRIAEGKFMGLGHAAALRYFLDRHLAGFDEVTRAFVIHLMWRSRISLSSRPLVSPTPSRPRWPI